MAQKLYPVSLNANGTLQLPKPVQHALHLQGKTRLVGFVVDGRRVLLTRARVVPETHLSDEELAALARLSKRGVGRRSFRTSKAALRYLWSL